MKLFEEFDEELFVLRFDRLVKDSNNGRKVDISFKLRRKEMLIRAFSMRNDLEDC
jgi:hypothetical protein